MKSTELVQPTRAKQNAIERMATLRSAPNNVAVFVWKKANKIELMQPKTKSATIHGESWNGFHFCTVVYNSGPRFPIWIIMTINDGSDHPSGAFSTSRGSWTKVAFTPSHAVMPNKITKRCSRVKPFGVVSSISLAGQCVVLQEHFFLRSSNGLDSVKFTPILKNKSVSD